jgi:hypothetical protein
MPRLLPRIVLLLAIGVVPVACSDRPAPSFDPTGSCTADGSAPGAYPDLEARIPKSYRGVPAERLDSGRNCSPASLGTLAGRGFVEVRFAGGTWTFGAERAVVLAVFNAPHLEADEMADFYADSARAASRTQILSEAPTMVAGRPGRRLDTLTGQRMQTVVVWPAVEADLVNVVISNDLPEARIADAIAAFNGG